MRKQPLTNELELIITYRSLSLPIACRKYYPTLPDESTLHKPTFEFSDDKENLTPPVFSQTPGYLANYD